MHVDMNRVRMHGDPGGRRLFGAWGSVMEVGVQASGCWGLGGVRVVKCWSMQGWGGSDRGIGLKVILSHIELQPQDSVTKERQRQREKDRPKKGRLGRWLSGYSPAKQARGLEFSSLTPVG